MNKKTKLTTRDYFTNLYFNILENIEKINCTLLKSIQRKKKKSHEFEGVMNDSTNRENHRTG